MTRLLTVALLVLGFAASTAAQGPAFVQLPSGGFVPCDHPLAIAAGLGCGQTTPTATTPAPLPTVGPGCDPRPNPYLEPARAAACTAWERDHTPKPALPSFTVGATYRDSYDTLRMVVLSVSLSLEGVPVVTAEYTHVGGAVVDGATPGAVFSFRVDQGRPWERVQ